MTSPPTSCPLCGQENSEQRTITVCGPCDRTLQASRGLALHSTGEFSVNQLMQAAGEQAAEPVSSPSAPVELHRCTWCGKVNGEVKKLLSRGPAHICNECVALCSDIMAAELGDDWRS